MGRRNYVAIVAYDPEVVSGAFGNNPDMNGRGGGRLSLAADFMVQGDSVAGPVGGPGGIGQAPFAGGGVVKYGPVIVPCLDFGR